MAFIGVADLTFVNMQLVSFYNRSFEFYTTTGLLYVAVVLIISYAGRRLERRQSLWIE
jgi:ABC-type amino acid transport system permease subunit